MYVFILTLTFIPIAISSIFKNQNNFIRNTHFNFDFNFDFDNIFGFIGLGSITGIVYLIGIALVIIASIKAKEGENYKYPFTIKFIK